MTYKEYQEFIGKYHLSKDELFALNDLLAITKHQIYEFDKVEYNPLSDQFYFKSKDKGVIIGWWSLRLYDPESIKYAKIKE